MFDTNQPLVVRKPFGGLRPVPMIDIWPVDDALACAQAHGIGLAHAMGVGPIGNQHAIDSMHY